ncbi:37S ribosomal protein S22 [Savitreella phatthalungensis]
MLTRVGVPGLRRLATRARASVKQPDIDQIFSGTAGDGVTVHAEEASEEDWRAALEALKEPASKAATDADALNIRDDALRFASNRLGQVVMPARIQSDTAEMVSEVHGPGIRAHALRFYEALRLKSEKRTEERDDLPTQLIMPASSNFTDMETVAYMAALMPQQYAAAHIVMLELRKRLGKEWLPEDILDVSVGPGVGAAAFQEVFIQGNPHPPSTMPRCTILEPNAFLRLRAGRLWRAEEHVKVARSLGNIKRGTLHDLIIASHAFADIKGHPIKRDDLVRELRARLRPGGVLVLIERGTPLGFESIARARDLLVRGNDEKGHIVAPCPHDGKCPMFRQGHQPDRRQWCHFSQRLQRPPFLQKTKHAKENTEDCPYSYIVYRHGQPRPQQTLPVTTAVSNKAIVENAYSWPRIVLPPLKRVKHVVVDVCAPSGEIERATVPKSQGSDVYRFARKSSWGDLLPFRGKSQIVHELHKNMIKEDRRPRGNA